MLTFEGQQLQGPAAIMEKLKSVGQVKHEVKSIDVQPSSTQSAIIIFVTGAVKVRLAYRCCMSIDGSMKSKCSLRHLHFGQRFLLHTFNIMTSKIGGDNPLHFCEMFQLVSTGPGAYYVHNDVFRLNYGL